MYVQTLSNKSIVFKSLLLLEGGVPVGGGGRHYITC